MCIALLQRAPRSGLHVIAHNLTESHTSTPTTYTRMARFIHCIYPPPITNWSRYTSTGMGLYVSVPPYPLQLVTQTNRLCIAQFGRRQKRCRSSFPAPFQHQRRLIPTNHCQPPATLRQDARHSHFCTVPYIRSTLGDARGSCSVVRVLHAAARRCIPVLVNSIRRRIHTHTKSRECYRGLNGFISH